ncbi:MAG: transporter substrate-binding domain-containing protein, partial [Selenomonadaceae bacterium]|nr:transporter substrate-binding domain-containing protein [Selenomonadaceae bacterium]
MVSLFALPAVAQAQEGKTVRVGWYESSFNTTDRFGRKSGYAYEYQQKIAAYTGWNYEYVVESWPKLLQMLMNGEIDLLSDVSYTAERSERMLFPSLAMGAEEYFVFVPSQNTAGIQGEDISSFNGKRIAVNQGSIQEVLLRDWADKNNLQIEIIPLTVGEADSIVMMNRGEFDARVSVHSISSRYDMMPVCKIGHSNIFFAVNRARPDLLQDLNFAMGKIYDENSYYNQYLRGKYISFAGANLFLTVKEQQWLTEHGPIRVGYRDNYMAFCAQDKDTGELTGALKDFLSMASGALKNAKIDFETVPFRTTSDALEALQRGEVDCIFPVNFSDYDGEELGLLITSPLMQTDMVAVVRESSQRKISMQEKLTVAVNEGDPNYDIFLMDSFPNWNRVYFKDTNACIEAVADDRADCLIVSNFRVNSLAYLMERYDLTAISTGKALRCTFAVRHEDGNLYAILNKVANVVPPSSVNTALAFYSQEEQPLILSHLLRKNAVPMLTGIGIIVVVILLLLLRSIRSEQRTRKALDDVAVLNETLSGSQKELKAALHDAEQANLAKTRFLANMSHELRTPMNAIIGLNTIALKDPNLTPYIREHLEKIGISAKHLLCIIESILDIRRIESGRMKVKEVDFSFRDFLNQINMIVNGQCENKGLQYDFRIIGKVEDRYVGDDAKLKRVLINILDNAVKFTEVPGTVTFTVEQTTSFENNRSLCFIIRDTGIGISKEFLPKIFDNFAQDVKRTDNVYGSTGLG